MEIVIDILFTIKLTFNKHHGCDFKSQHVATRTSKGPLWHNVTPKNRIN